jgi:transcriptional regulator with PAS, ATPase and Fis domain
MLLRGLALGIMPLVPPEPVRTHAMNPVATEGALSIAVWSAKRGNAQSLLQVLADIGLNAAISTPETVPPASSKGTGVYWAVLGIDRESNGDFEQSLVAVRAFRQAGYQVLCCGTHAAAWPLADNCRVLLSGARHLLDQSAAGFRGELTIYLEASLRDELTRRNEAGALRTRMRDFGMVGQSDSLLTAFRRVLNASTLSDLPLLITGESGTGKELFARALHSLDPLRNSGPFLAVNCAAITPTLAEAEFFGHRKGSFTGAERDRKGLFRSADGGILFLDEIGELSLEMQAKLLRVLQEGKVLGVGHDHEVSVNVRVVAATNRELAGMVETKRFREDLFYRLNVLSIHIPPIRERTADIQPLVEHFLGRHQGAGGNNALTVASGFIEALSRLRLAGNARQLENLVRWVLVNKRHGAQLTVADLPPDIWRHLSAEEPTDPAAIVSATAATSGTGSVLRDGLVDLLRSHEWNLERSLESCERLLVEAALEHASGNQSKAARLLGITPRSVYNKLKKHRIA